MVQSDTDAGGHLNETLTLLVHAESGAGKSWLGQTTPAPRLVLDAESGGSRFARRVGEDGVARKPKSVHWDPHSDGPPAAGEWETCFVSVKSIETLQRTYEWLNIGEHPFRSIVMDSLTEVQDICKKSIRTGDEVMNERMWGILLDRMTALVKDFRDLREHPVAPVSVVLILALSIDLKGKIQPLVQGQLRDKLPGWVDTLGALHPSVTIDGEYEGRLLIRPNDRFVAKDRTHTLSQRYGPVIAHPDVEQMLAVLNEEED